MSDKVTRDDFARVGVFCAYITFLVLHTFFGWRLIQIENQINDIRVELKQKGE